MSRAWSIGWLKLASLAIVVILAQSIAQSALAQPEEGRRGRGEGRGGRGMFGAPMLRVASNEDVQGVLKLSDEQKEKIEDLDDEMRDEFRSLWESGGDRDEMRKLSEEGAKKLTEILDEDQEKRITEIVIQAYGVNAILMHPTLGEHLNVTDEQRTQLSDAQRDNWDAMRDAFRDIQDLSGEERRAKFDELRTEADKKLMAVLTSEQQKQLDSLKGEKVDMDLQQLRMFGGRGGRDGDRGGRDRNRDGERDGRDRDRDRDRDSDDSDDSSAGN